MFNMAKDNKTTQVLHVGEVKGITFEGDIPPCPSPPKKKNLYTTVYEYVLD